MTSELHTIGVIVDTGLDIDTVQGTVEQRTIGPCMNIYTIHQSITFNKILVFPILITEYTNITNAKITQSKDFLTICASSEPSHYL